MVVGAALRHFQPVPTRLFRHRVEGPEQDLPRIQLQSIQVMPAAASLGTSPAKLLARDRIDMKECY